MTYTSSSGLAFVRINPALIFQVDEIVCMQAFPASIHFTLRSGETIVVKSDAPIAQLDELWKALAKI